VLDKDRSDLNLARSDSYLKGDRVGEPLSRDAGSQENCRGRV
jgi:hypothetical protein